MSVVLGLLVAIVIVWMLHTIFAAIANWLEQ